MPNRSNAQPPDYDRAILAIAEYLYHKTPRLKRCHSGCNYCVILTFDDGTADRVLKMANLNDWAVEFERHLYPPMRAHGVPVPEIEFTQEDYPGPPVPFIVMPKFSDHTLYELCETDPTAALSAFEESGRFIRELDERFGEAYRPFLEERELFGTLKLQQKVHDRELDFAPDLMDIIGEKDPSLAQQIERHLATFDRPFPKRLVHGSLHIGNIMATRGGDICVIDLGEGIGMSSRLKDLYMLLMMAPRWKGSENDYEAKIRALHKGYGEINKDEVQELRYWEFLYSVTPLQGIMEDYPNAASTREHLERLRAILDGQSRLPCLVLHQ